MKQKTNFKTIKIIENKGEYSIFAECRVNFSLFSKYSVEKIGIIKKNKYNDFVFKSNPLVISLDKNTLLETALFMDDLEKKDND